MLTFALQELERHQRRREQGIPTLTVLSGPPALASSLWRRWLGARPLCTSAASSEPALLRDWAEALARARDLQADAADFLGDAAGLAPGELRARLRGKTSHERDVLLQELLPSAPSGDSTSACRCLLQPQVVHKSGVPLDALLEACDGDALRAFAALHALVPRGEAPAVLLVGSHAARVAARLGAFLPSLVLALAVERSSLDVYLRGSESQALAMVREGLVELEAPSAEALGHKLEALGVRQPEALSGSLARLAAEGVSEEVLALFGEAARARQEASHEDTPKDRARSSAERFLAAFLESHPATQGLFELNADPGFRLAGRPVEVDLLARRPAVAIEIDGWHHFREPEDYRRDRRKDLALQRHGYLVLRFLAQDVVDRIEEILEAIRGVLSVDERPSP